ncbi:MAG: hypothetical protein CMQ39_08905 [Gammaproteobacteria bacterium]|nr:hypothetical protein [Gammaproteobacteria bacterium]|tara:strand:- start:209 stop:787 length:579 start_codon:yes stop_codon:yes gene_type:complete
MPTLALLSVCLAPFTWVLLKVIFSVVLDTNYFGADPGIELVAFFGQIATLFLFLTISFSSLGKISKTWGIPRMRRILGLSVFFYATLHLLSYLIFLGGLEVGTYFHDLMTKKRIIFGSLAYFFLFLLAATSFDSAVRNLAKVWSLLHRLVYFIAGLVVLHVFLSSKANFAFAFFFFCAYLILIGLRLQKAWR